MFAAHAEASECSADGSSSKSSSSQANVKQTIQQGLAALVAGSSLQELLLADTGMTQDDLAAIFSSSSSSSSSGQQLQRLDVHNNRLLARGDSLHLGQCLQHLQVGTCEKSTTAQRSQHAFRCQALREPCAHTQQAERSTQ